MSRRNFGGFLSANEQATDSASANGIYTLSEAQQKTALGVFPTGRWTPQRSVRLRSTSFSRTLSGSATKFTYSCWVKRSRVNSSSAPSYLFQLWDGVVGHAGFSCFFSHTGYGTADQIYVVWDTYNSPGSGYSNTLNTTAVFRDPSAWYHVVIAVDTVTSTYAGHAKVYVNNILYSTTTGTEYNSWSSGLSVALSTMYLGATNSGSTTDGYFSENVFVDGQALTPSSFGQTDPTTGMWVPKRYTGTYGTNGYYLPFNDPTSTTTIGYDRQLGFTDSSKNNFTASGVSVTPGTTYDSMVDVPGIPSVTSQPDIGGVQRGNYAVANPLIGATYSGVTYSEGNLKVASDGSSSTGNSYSTMPIPTSGKWYCEITAVKLMTSPTGATRGYWGLLKPYISTNTASLAIGVYSDHTSGITSTAIWSNGSSIATITNLANNDVIGIAVNVDAGTVQFLVNGSSVYSGSYATSSGDYFVGVTGDSGEATRNYTAIYNFGQRAFSYTPPTGYKSLCSANLPNPAVARSSDHFDVKTYYGNNKALTVGNIAKQTSAYQISKSLRFRSSNSGYLSRTLATPTNNKIWTWSAWLKRGTLNDGGATYIAKCPLFDAPSSASTFDAFYIRNNDYIVWYFATGGATTGYLESTAVFRDPSAWYHLVFVYDSTQATDSNRMKVYVNGSQIAVTSASYVAQNTNSRINSAVVHKIGAFDASSNYADCYLTEINFIDGQQLTPSSFGQFDANNNWVPKQYTGTYGNNGFYLPFNDSTSTTTIGYDRQVSLTDSSKNNFTASGISVTAGITNDSLFDTPTDYGTDTGAGGEVGGNYCVLNPNDSTNVTIRNGNLQITYATASWSGARATMAVPKTGKWKWEVSPSTMAYGFLALAMPSAATNTSGYTATNVYSWYLDSGEIRYSNNNQVTVAAAVANDICEVRVDNAVVSFYKNNSLMWTFTQKMTDISDDYYPAAYVQSGAVHNYNFGQRPFAYTVSGFNALNTKNLKDAGSYNLPDNYGNFVNSPDLVWIKSRSNSASHAIYDSVRGPALTLSTDAYTSAETSEGTTALQQFLPNGLQLGANNSGLGNTNSSGYTYVAWTWNAGSSTVTNTTGSKECLLRANPTAGISVALFTQTTGAFTVGHGLGVAPNMVITRDVSSTNGWIVYHSGMDATNPENYYMVLHGSSGGRSSATAAGGIWYATRPNSQVVSFGDTATWWGASGVRRLMYSFAAIPGFSSFGYYTGNGSSTAGPFVYTGFRPRYVMTRRTDSTSDWFIWDAARDPYNPVYHEIYAEVPNAEVATMNSLDFVSNGFRLTTTSTDRNGSGATYMYMAFAEAPFKYANAR